jgi:hypothetical protein
MLKITEENIKGLEMSFNLSERDGAILSSFIKTEAFHLLQKLMEQEVRLMNIRLLNTDTSNPQEILSNHAVAKGAGMFYVGLMQRLQEVLQVQMSSASTVGSPANPEVPNYVDEVS